MLFFYRDMVKKNGGRFEGKIVVSNEVDDLLCELPVFDSIGYIGVLWFVFHWCKGGRRHHWAPWTGQRICAMSS